MSAALSFTPAPRDPARSFQDMILTLHDFWSANGCVILQPYDMRMGAGTFHTATTLRALGPDQSVERVSAGATFAAKQKASSRDVRAWVDEQLSKEAGPVEGGEEAATGPTFLAGRKALEVGAAIGKAADRRRWVNRFLKLNEEEQGAYRYAVKASARNFEKLSLELDAAMDDA